MVPKENGFNQSERLPVVARARCDVLQARLPWQGIVKLYNAAFLSSRRHYLPSKVRLHNHQTPRNVYMWMQQ